MFVFYVLATISCAHVICSYVV